jgi:hypothetical protein
MIPLPVTIVVTGGRDWAHPDRLTRVLDQTAAGEQVRLLVGDCPTGADQHTRAWAMRTPQSSSLARSVAPNSSRPNRPLRRRSRGYAATYRWHCASLPLTTWCR